MCPHLIVIYVIVSTVIVGIAFEETESQRCVMKLADRFDFKARMLSSHRAHLQPCTPILCAQGHMLSTL
jgi:hypothetical protein